MKNRTSLELSRRQSAVVPAPQKLTVAELQQRNAARAAAGTFARALLPFLRELMKLLWIWSFVPVLAAISYGLLNWVDFPYPGIGIFAGATIAFALLHRGTSPPYCLDFMGLAYYCGSVLLLNESYLLAARTPKQDILNALLLAQGEPITTAHWVGFLLFGLSSAFFAYEIRCTGGECPGYCLHGYRRQLRSTHVALRAVGAEVPHVLHASLRLTKACFSLLSLKISLWMKKRSRAPLPAPFIDVEVLPAPKDTAVSSEPMAIEAPKERAFDFATKPQPADAVLAENTTTPPKHSAQ